MCDECTMYLLVTHICTIMKQHFYTTCANEFVDKGPNQNTKENDVMLKRCM